jgi:N-acetylated-alpha-linked acidic dipeptidase
MNLVQSRRESTDLENRIISSGGYAIGEDPTKKYVISPVKPDVPYLDFSPLQNALHQLEISVERVNTLIKNNITANSVSVTFNRSLYKAEQQLLIENGLPRREWYKHSIYAPGFYTGYGVKTLPGIREAIEQRNWNEAQQQITADAKAIMNLAEYFNALSPGGN